MRRRLLLIGTLVLLVAGTASAYFTSSGSGAASRTAGTMQPVTVTALVGGDTPSSVLLPGTTGDVILRVNNPNSYAVTLQSVMSGPGSLTADSGHPNCTTSGVAFNNQTGLSTTIAASGTTLVDLPGAASMSTTSSNGCQGATFSIPVTITVQKG